MLLKIILATTIISLISFVGVFLSPGKKRNLLHYLISFSAAILISMAFFDLIPNALWEFGVSENSLEKSFLYVVVGIAIFFLIERFIHWHHCGMRECSKKSLGSLILFGDFVHNFLDGFLVAGAFLLNESTGVAAAISVGIHEIPQEIGDFAVLIHSGMTERRALFLNFLSATSAVFGGIIGFFLFGSLTTLVPYFVLILAGGFLYLALSDILPELHKAQRSKLTLAIETLIFLITLFLFKFFLGVHK